MIGLLLMTMGLIGLLYWLAKGKSGSITLPPSDGEVVIKTGFEPDEVIVYFVDDDYCAPSCVELEDKINNIRILRHGFKFDFKIESGIRTIEWLAKK